MNPTADSTLMRIATGQAQAPWERMAAVALHALSFGYGLALEAHLAGYRLGLARRTRLPALVISVGNLTLGGTGKTTASLAVARWLSEQGRRVAYLSRGYRGAGEGKEIVVSEGLGPLVPVETAGDEPFMVSRALPGVFVLAGKDRRRTSRLALDRWGANAIVLDDGYQYQRLARDLDIALVDALLPFGYDFLVPRGLLREPPSHLGRADAVWLTHSDLVKSGDLEALRSQVGSLAPQARVWEAVHRPARLRSLAGEEELEPSALSGRKLCALSSLGNPSAFELALGRLGAEVVARIRFPDHYRYRRDELQATIRARSAGAEWVVTTEKDAVRMPQEALDRPAWALGVELAGRPGEPSLSEELAWLLGAKGKM